jgi:small subunit ribosomal protein S4
MTKRAESKYKINRRLGVNLWGRAKSPLAKREYGPGQHGQRRKNKPTDFGIQLMAKQKLKGYYGNIGEKQFRKYYEEAVRRKGDTSENLIELLERRLDAVIYRMKLAVTPFAARQFVNHGHVIEVKEKSKQLAAVLDAVQSSERDVPEYLEIDVRAMRGKFLRAPKLSDVPYPVQMEPNLVVEFYSR